MEYKDWDQKTKQHFGDYLSLDDEWEIIKNKYQIGDKITGKVIAKAPFGAWVDIEVGFPALLEIIDIKDLKPTKYQADDWCPEDSLIEAKIAGFIDRRKQIYLTQKELEI